MSYSWKAKYVIKNLQISKKIKVDKYTFSPSEENKNETLLEFDFEIENKSSAEKHAEEEKELILDALSLQNRVANAERIALSGVNHEGKITSTLNIKMSIFIVNKDLDKDKLKKTIEVLEEKKSDKMLTLSLRWFRKGSLEKDTYDKFFSLWISFNALYQEYENKVKSSREEIIEKLVRDIFNFSEAQEILGSLSDKIINTFKELDSKRLSRRTKEALNKSIEERDYLNALKFILLKLYALRNSIFHSDFLYGDKRNVIETANKILINTIRKILLYRLNIT